LLLLCWFFAFAGTVAAQTLATATPAFAADTASATPAKAPSAVTDNPAQGGERKPGKQQPKPAGPAVRKPAEHKITPQEADELFRSVDEILAFASKDTGLPIKEPVKRKLADREEVERYIERRMREDKDAQRLERSAASLKKFGLLPRDFELRSFLLGLLKEQVAGFYDSKTKTVYLLDWVEAEAQKPVLAHELTHALQDQSFDIDKWMGDSKSTKSDQEELELEEAQSAREAVIEGQAMVVLLDYMLDPVGRSVADSPEVIDAIKGEVLEVGQTPMFAKAPLFLREALTFPYTQGLEFERQVLAKKGRTAAYRGVFENPPKDTRQILQPQMYLAGEAVPTLTVPVLDAVLKPAYKRYDFGALGEFDIDMLLWQWLGKREPLARAWRGGYYFTYENAVNPGPPYALVSVTRWANSNDAREFASFYAASLAKRYINVKELQPLRDGSGQWQTEEGPVDISVSGKYTVAIESLPAGERIQVQQAIQKTFAGDAQAAQP
jgi:hypothetical protein